MTWVYGVVLGIPMVFCLLGVVMAVRYFPDRRRMPTSPDVAKLLQEIRQNNLFTAAGCDDAAIARVAATYGFRVVDRDGTILKLRRNVFAKFRSLSAGGKLLGVVLFPLSVGFAAGLMIGLGVRRGYDELIHLDTVARNVVDI